MSTPGDSSKTAAFIFSVIGVGALVFAWRGYVAESMVLGAGSTPGVGGSYEPSLVFPIIGTAIALGCFAVAVIVRTIARGRV